MQPKICQSNKLLTWSTALLFGSSLSNWAARCNTCLLKIDAERRSLFLSFPVKPCLTSVLPTHRLLVEYSDPARAGGSLAVVDPALGTLTDLHTPFTSFGSLSVAQVVPYVLFIIQFL